MECMKNGQDHLTELENWIKTLDQKAKRQGGIVALISSAVGVGVFVAEWPSRRGFSVCRFLGSCVLYQRCLASAAQMRKVSELFEYFYVMNQYSSSGSAIMV